VPPFSSDPYIGDCATVMNGASDCLGVVAIGNVTARQDIDDMSSEIEFIRSPHTKRYGMLSVQRINVTTAPPMCLN
jgi:hypothetical protein